MQRTESLTMAEYAYIELRDRIIDMRLPPGSALDEDALMSELGVGRTPMREAVKRLESDRMLTVYSRRGTIVADVNILDLRLISDARRVMESYAARCAAERATAADRRKLRELIEQIDGSQTMPAAQQMNFDASIHRQIYAVMRNSYLETTLAAYFNLSLRLWNFVLDRLPSIGGNLSEHITLLQAIIDGDADKAALLAEEHVTHFEERIRSIL
ncbi:GntR family transcriptional regulator [Specibacter cremeus]|uniref:GntR family transcriptional regulator n=1 Tax=Specibacter cremeus TaxID=1629051 RepID=UPI000F7B32D7|nr:GntR family transcriptional regulator [Specibacter cremeus]